MSRVEPRVRNCARTMPPARTSSSNSPRSWVSGSVTADGLAVGQAVQRRVGRDELEPRLPGRLCTEHQIAIGTECERADRQRRRNRGERHRLPSPTATAQTCARRSVDSIAPGTRERHAGPIGSEARVEIVVRAVGQLHRIRDRSNLIRGPVGLRCGRSTRARSPPRAPRPRRHGCAGRRRSPCRSACSAGS